MKKPLFNVGAFEKNAKTHTLNLIFTNVFDSMVYMNWFRNNEMRYSYVQVSYTIAGSKETEDREYRQLESIRDNYPKYVVSVDSLLQQRNGILHVNMVDFMKNGKNF